MPAPNVLEQLAEVWDDPSRESEEPGEAPEEESEGQPEGEPEEETRESEDQEPEGEGDEPDAEPEGKDAYTVAEIAEALGWDVADLYNHMVLPVDDGEPIPLGKLKDARHEIATTKEELERGRQELEQQRQEQQQQLQQWLQQQNQVSEERAKAQQQLSALEVRYNDLRSQEQKALQSNDTAALARINSEVRNVLAEYGHHKGQLAQLEQHENVQRQQFIEQDRWQHYQKLLEVVPEWRDEAKAREENERINSMLVEKIGFSPQELGGIYDYRARVLARWALRGMEAAEREQAGRKALKAAPKKLIKPGGGKAPDTRSAKLKSVVAKAQGREATWRDRRRALDAMMGADDSLPRGRNR